MKAIDLSRKKLLRGLALGMLLIAAKTGYDFAYPNRTFLIGVQVASCLPWDYFYWDGDKPVGEIRRYDILVFPARKMEPFIKDGSNIVKMAAGLPGDRIVVRNGIVAVNGDVIGDVSYGASRLRKPINHWDRDYVLGQDEIFVFGTEYNSYDSRYWGPYPKHLVRGHVTALF